MTPDSPPSKNKDREPPESLPAADQFATTSSPLPHLRSCLLLSPSLRIFFIVGSSGSRGNSAPRKERRVEIDDRQPCDKSGRFAITHCSVLQGSPTASGHLTSRSESQAVWKEERRSEEDAT
eukprot:255813-Hanusia_phi.AAC.1